MGIPVEKWIMMTSSNPGEDTKQWFGLEMLLSDIELVMKCFINRVGRGPLTSYSDMKDGRVHADIYVTAKEFDIINNIIDDKLVKKNDRVEE